jgi:hypothetical protein
MTAQGTPDFHEPFVAGDVTVLFPFAGGNRYFLLPGGLEVATRNDGQPDFSLELVASAAGGTLSGYSVLDVKLRAVYRRDEALLALRRSYPDAVLACAGFTAGFLRFVPATSDLALPAELTAPARLDWNDLGATRFVMKLAAETGSLLRDSLKSGALLLGAVAEMELSGLTPRLPLRARFDAARLLDDLGALAGAGRRVASDDVQAFFSREWATLPLEVRGQATAEQTRQFAAVMTDRVRASFGRFVPAPSSRIEPHFALLKPEEAAAGVTEWNLAEPARVPRTITLSLHPLEAAQRLVKEKGEKGLSAIVRETKVPPMQTGVHQVTVTANLPVAERVGLLAIGANLRVPPKPPRRAQAVNASARFAPPDDAASLTLRLAPKEPLEFSFTTYAVLQSGQTVKRHDGPPVNHAGGWLSLSAGDFPVEFLFVESSSALLDIARIEGVCRWGGGNAQPFTLEQGRAAIALALPTGAKGAAAATLEIEAIERDGQRRIRLGPAPAEDLLLDLFSFAEYGPHRVEIECALGNQSSHAIELLPEGLPGNEPVIETLLFTRAEPKREWTWFAGSPFRAGYRYRARRGAGETPAAWSDLQSPFAPLRINATTGGRQ